MSFLSGIEESDDRTVGEAGLPLLTQPDEPSIGDGTPDARHVDLRLQTRLGSERLQGRLLSIYYDAQTYEQEQGVSILYLAMGFLKWYESPSSDKARYAPLLLIPVDLKRQTAASRFHIEYREEDITTNLSLQAKLRGEFGIDLPEIPDMDELTPGTYFDSVAAGGRQPASLGGLEGRHGRLVLLVREVSDVPRPRPGHMARALAVGNQPEPVAPPG